MPITGFRFANDLLLWVGGSNEIPSSEWEAYCELSREVARQRVLESRFLDVLIVTDSSAPNSVHRNAWNEVVGAVEVRSAVIASDPVMRNIATAFNWMNRTMKFVAPKDWREALSFLHVSHSMFPALLVEIAAIEATLQDRCRCVELLKQHEHAA